jgi:hypothetical protein
MKRLTSQSRTTTTIRTPQAGPSGQLRRCCATESLLIGLVLRRLFVKSGSRVERSSFADAGAWIALLMTMSLALTPCPYSLPLPSPSGRSVEPSRETPANNPREREYERTSARNVTSAPSLTWLVRMESAIYFQRNAFLRSNHWMKSVIGDWPKPVLPLRTVFRRVPSPCGA